VTAIGEMQPPAPVHYLPIGTTLLSAVFFAVLIRRYAMKRSGPHLLWWAAGVAAYGLGTAVESAITVWGNTSVLFKSWYVAGALLGGYPLAQGTVYLLLSRRAAHTLTAVTVPFLALLSFFVILSPIRPEAMHAYRPSGDALEWQWIRFCTPLVNSYAAIFLIGGAILSAGRYAHDATTRHRAIGNILIAFGALLPGIGGGLAKGGLVEGLYLGEFLGIILIWAGYGCCVSNRARTCVETNHSDLPARPAGPKNS
jgi:hypothetical protein